MMKWLWREKKSEEKREERGQAFSGFGSLAIASTQCIGPDRLPIRYARRREPSHAHDTGWTFFSGQEADEFSATPSNFKPVQLARCIEMDSSLQTIVDSPVGSEWTRKPPEDIWWEIIDGNVVDGAGRVIGKTS